MYCAFIMIHSDAYYWNKVSPTVMNHSSHGQAIHLICAMGMIVQHGSCGPRCRQANREILPSCLSIYLEWPGGKVHTTILRMRYLPTYIYLFFCSRLLFLCVVR